MEKKMTFLIILITILAAAYALKKSPIPARIYIRIDESQKRR
jgi:hypothetical protein